MIFDVETPPAFGPSGEAVYQRTYQREKQNGKREAWAETVERVVLGNIGLVYGKPDTWPEWLKSEAQELFDSIYNFRLLPAGRHLWASGVPGRQYLFNCHVSGWGEKFSDHFSFTFLRLMEGGGVGANYSSHYLAPYRIRRKLRVHIVCDPSHPDYEKMKAAGVLSDSYSAEWPGAFEVTDSREGWDAGLVDLLDTFTTTDEVAHANRVYDVTNVRPEGARLKTMGGRASGPLPFAKMMLEVGEILSATRNGEGKGLVASLQAMDVDHAIASCVVAGGNRRSARMAMVRWDDPHVFEFIDGKTNGGHWTTNISVEIDYEFLRRLHDGDEHASAVHAAVVKGMMTNGEPGYWNSELSNVGEPNPVTCTNPCGEIALEDWENCFTGDTEVVTPFGPIPLESLVEWGGKATAWHEGSWHSAEARSFGVQPVNAVTFEAVRATRTGVQRSRSSMTKDVTVTPDHRWHTENRGLVTDLRLGDVVRVDPAAAEKSAEYSDGFRHGLIYGDGSHARESASGDHVYRMRLFGRKAKYAELFEHATYPAAGVEVWHRTWRDDLKSLPQVESSGYLSGFLAGWIATDGSEKPNGRVQLSSGDPAALGWLQRNAASAGWDLRGLATTSKATNYGERKRPLQMFALSREGLWRVSDLRPAGSQEVFCLTVPGVERFTLGNGLTTYNCNLGHVNLDAFAGSSAKELFRAHELMTRFLIRATYGDVNDPKQAEKLARNRRIGVGHLGVQGFLVKSGIKYSEAPASGFGQVLQELREVCREAARRYSFQLRIPEPVKVTTVAPTGSIAKLPGVTEGIHALLFLYFNQRIRFSTVDPDQLAKVEEYRAQGFHVEDDVVADNTVVVTFPSKAKLLTELEEMGLDPDLLESTDDLTPGQMLAFQAMYQTNYADNAVSYTVNFSPEKVTEGDLSETLLKWLPHLKGTTFLPEGSYEQAPFERLSKAEYEAASLHVVADGLDDECAGGSCPVR